MVLGGHFMPIWKELFKMLYQMDALETFAKFTGKLLHRSNINVYKLIGVYPATFTSSKSAVETLENGVKYVQSSGVFIIDFEYISDLFLVFLLFTMNRFCVNIVTESLEMSRCFI